jgi:hypothetical protein
VCAAGGGQFSSLRRGRVFGQPGRLEPAAPGGGKSSWRSLTVFLLLWRAGLLGALRQVPGLLFPQSVRALSCAEEIHGRPRTNDAGTQAATTETVILEPSLPARLKDSAPDADPDWHAKVLEALAKHLTETNDFYHPLLDAARELRDLRSVRASLIELLRTVSPYTRSYARYDFVLPFDSRRIEGRD